MTLETVRLGKVADYIRGITFKPADVVPPHSPESVVCMTTKNVQEALDESKLTAVSPRFVKRKEQYLEAGDILISSANSWNLVGKVSFVPDLPYIAAAGGFISILRAHRDRIDPRYLYHWMASGETQHRARLCARQTTNIANLDRERFLQLEVPLPPLPEQRRIAAILDKADAVRRKRQQTLDLADQFLRSAFLDMFGDPVTNPKGWPVRKLGDVTESKLGKMLSKASRRDVNPVEYLGNSNVRWRHFDLWKLATMDFTPDELQKLDLRDGDLLMCEGGEIGRCAIWHNDQPGISFQKALHRVRCNRKTIMPEYIQETVMFMAERGGLVHSTSVATIAHLTGVRLRRLCLPLPPIGLQKAFAEICSKYRELSARCVEASARAATLQASLVQRAFRGDLT